MRVLVVSRPSSRFRVASLPLPVVSISPHRNLPITSPTSPHYFPMISPSPPILSPSSPHGCEQEIFLQKLAEKSYAVNDTIIAEGKENSTFYIIKAGEVKVETKENGRLDEVNV